MDDQHHRSLSREPNWSSRLTCLALVLLLVLFAFTIPLLLLQIGSAWISGQEFAPGTFQRRDFEYMEIPWLHRQISGISRTSSTSDLEKYLKRKNYIQTSKPVANDRWDLVYDTQTARTSAACDAAILCQYLDSRDSEGALVWLDWTRENPDLAEIFWPEIADLAREGQYILVPALFQMAIQARDPRQLKQDIDQYLADQFADLGREAEAMDKHQQAIEFFDRALSHVADHEAALKRRDSLLEARGN